MAEYECINQLEEDETFREVLRVCINEESERNLTARNIKISSSYSEGGYEKEIIAPLPDNIYQAPREQPLEWVWTKQIQIKN